MRTAQLLLALLLAASTLPASMRAADAQESARHGNNRPDQRPDDNLRQLDINAVFEQLQVARLGRSGEVVVDYTLSQNTWAELRASGITPQLNIHVPGPRNNRYVFRYSVRLSSPQGRILYPAALGISAHNTVELELVGYEGAASIVRSTYRRASEQRLRMAVEQRAAQPTPPPQPQPQPNHPHHPHHPPYQEPNDNERRAIIISACNSVGSFDSERRACQERAMSMRGPMLAETIKACGKKARSASSWDACIDYANANPYSYRVETISSCDQISSFESEFKTCIGKAKALPQPAAPIINACKAATSFNSEMNSCLDLAAPLGPGAESVVRACKQGSSFNSDFQRCMRDANRPVGNRR